MSPAFRTIEISTRREIAPDRLQQKLVDCGYERTESVVASGQFSLHGGELAIFATNHIRPVRISFFGNAVESIKEFDLTLNKVVDRHDLVAIEPNQFITPESARILPGAYVVHDDHGIGQFDRLMTKIIAGEHQSYAVILYRNEDRLYMPMNQAAKISSYIGINKKAPRLSRLGSQSWQKTYKKTYENIILVAKELLMLYAKRQISTRPRWKIDSSWDKAIKSTFDYVDTADQSASVAAVYKDLEKNIPMDRLICGDVGFGKTEVAIRAIAQTCANGFQAALLVPTTILCEQHYQTLKERFRDLPVSIARLSRFVDKKDQEKIIQEINDAKVDIVIGTHKLLSSQIKYPKLGLLVIDEEQKFGVKDKEKIKQLRTDLNVLTMTATPIPRTLFMGLSGIRDVSELYSVPLGRKEVETEIAREDKSLAAKYVMREIDRNGQIYYLHNEVETIGGKANELRKAFPGIRIEVAHGQMDERKLSETMGKFAAGEIDLLVCSTIIENGLDLSRANTLIVDNADRFGLSQLYQIRGRIGRGSHQAYSLFMHGNHKITDNAFKRLKALAENTELGSGKNISVSDLEIRGGGNILGREQHGNMEAIGLVLYGRMLQKAVSELKAEKKITGTA